METSVWIVLIIFGWLTLMSILVAALPDKRANRLKSFVKMCLSSLLLSAAVARMVEAFRKKERK